MSILEITIPDAVIKAMAIGDELVLGKVPAGSTYLGESNGVLRFNVPDEREPTLTIGVSPRAAEVESAPPRP